MFIEGPSHTRCISYFLGLQRELGGLECVLLSYSILSAVQHIQYQLAEKREMLGAFECLS